ncbi:hypothetical protein [Micromonospora carbonacea]|uniref:Uncharacterized protein n=1 Tax=Micromonospora carbonacea TaxID=47853 RepID=A0A7H8XTR3_9ACTN|nr:hypothetical protein [Micromonospora carbonacea]MBB5829845.1 hypothetical protein [Micromonospora carbonacea]QLD28185.1 hypothetical protein HXZ27_31550 [Micromonospora carbonacea]
MRHRDWGRGEGSPRERQASLPWDASGDQPPADSHGSAVERYRTPSRRRAARRGQQEPVETYLPRWALDSGVERADGGGRHAAPDDEDDARARSGSGSGWRTTETTTSWRRVSETTWRDVPAIEAAPERERPGGWRDVPAIGAAPEPERPGGWRDEALRDDASRDGGYVGSRRADEDDPVSGAARAARPRRSSSRRPQVVWSGLEDVGTATGADAAEGGGRRTRRSRRAGADSWSTRPAVDPWARGAADAPETTGEAASYQPAVDPWDASGVHAWDRPAVESRWESPAGAARWDQTGEIGDLGRWDQTGEIGRWDRTGEIGRWEETGDVGRWDQTGEIGRWDRAGETGRRERSTAETGQWGRVDDGQRWDRAVEPRSGDAPVEGWSWPEHVEGFWSGTRLAGDDPRWMDAPPSAPQSPVVPYTAPRPRSAPRRRAEPGRRRGEPVGDARAVGVPSRRRAEPVPVRSWNRRLEDDLLDPDPGGPFRPLVYTAACYLLPAVLVFVWLLTLDGQAPAGCVTDISGGGCDSPRSHALGSLVNGAPRFGLALASSLVVALLLRRVGTTWRSATVALAAAVVGGGLSTVMISAVTGQPIG